MNKKNLYVLLANMLVSIHCYSQSIEMVKNKHIQICQKIDSIRKQNNVYMKDFDDGSLFGGQLTYLKDQNKIVLIECLTSNSSKYFYFNDEVLIYAIERLKKRIQPTTIVTSDSSNHVNYETTNSIHFENHYFFTDQQLISYTYNNENELDIKFGKKSKIKKEIIEADADRILKEAYKYKNQYK